MAGRAGDGIEFKDEVGSYQPPHPHGGGWVISGGAVRVRDAPTPLQTPLKTGSSRVNS